MSTVDTTTNRGTDRGGILAYLAIAFGLAWAIWAVVLYGLKLDAHDPGFAIALIPGMFAPAIAAIVVRKWVTGEGFTGAGLRPRLRRGRRYYLFAILLAPGLTVLIIALTVMFGVAEPQPHFRLGAASPPLALIIAIAVTPLLWGEEFGWRGYLQPRLVPGRPVWSAIATGAIWGLWHYPLIVLTGFNYPDSPVLGLIPFTLFTIFMSVILGWLQLRAGSSWAPSLAHSGVNYFAAPILTAVFPGASALAAGIGSWAALPAFALVAGWIVATGRLRPQSAAFRSPVRPGAQPAV
jgi:CAAX protease family protein